MTIDSFRRKFSALLLIATLVGCASAHPRHPSIKPSDQLVENPTQPTQLPENSLITSDEAVRPSVADSAMTANASRTGLQVIKKSEYSDEPKSKEPPGKVLNPTPAAEIEQPPSAVYDPWQLFNRRVHRFNAVVDGRSHAPLPALT